MVGAWGGVRRVVERTIPWLKGLRRMRVCYDRPGVIDVARNTLAARVICFQLLDEGLALAESALAGPVGSSLLPID